MRARGVLREGQRAQHARAPPEGGGDHVVVDALTDGRRRHVAVQEAQHLCAHQGQQRGLTQEAAAHHDPAGREDADHADHAKSKIVSFEGPRGMVSGQRLRRLTPALRHGVRRGEALETVAVIRAGSGERIGIAIVRHADVAHLRVHQPVERPTIDECAAADARPHGEVDERVETPRGSPAMLADGRRVHVGVDRHRRAEARAAACPPDRSRPSPAWAWW